MPQLVIFVILTIAGHKYLEAITQPRLSPVREGGGISLSLSEATRRDELSLDGGRGEYVVPLNWTHLHCLYPLNTAERGSLVVC